jgi:hypothetical protein
MRTLLAALLAALPAVARAQCDPAQATCAHARAAVTQPAVKPGGQTYNWGQGDPGTIHAVFEKTAGGAKKNKFVQENQGWFSKLIGRDPSIEAKVELSKDYLPDDSPAVVGTDADGDPVVKVGRAALDATQSEGEMAFLLGHELHHTVARKRKMVCLNLGVKARGSTSAVKDSPELKKYRVDLEREADAWGQKYAADAGYNPLAAVDAIRHVNDLGEALGAETGTDAEHDSYTLREEQLKKFGGAPFEAACPWPAS